MFFFKVNDLSNQTWKLIHFVEKKVSVPPIRWRKTMCELILLGIFLIIILHSPCLLNKQSKAEYGRGSMVVDIKIFSTICFWTIVYSIQITYYGFAWMLLYHIQAIKSQRNIYIAYIKAIIHIWNQVHR